MRFKASAMAIIGINALLLAPAAVAAAGLPAILADPEVRASEPLPDFSFAGYGFGTTTIPDNSGIVIDVTSYGVIPDDSLDDSKAVLRALAAANAVTGKVTLRFPKGRTQITEVLRITRSDIVLDGAGPEPGGSELYFPRPLKLIDSAPDFDELRTYMASEKKIQEEPENNIHYLFSEYSWAGGMIFVGPPDTRPVSYDPAKDVRDTVLAKAVSGKQFDRTLMVENSVGLSVGQVVQLQWFADKGRNSAILTSLYGDTTLPVGAHHWSFPNRPTVVQSTRILAIDRNMLTLGDPLLHDIRADQRAVVANWQHLTNVGIQNLHFQFPVAPSFGHHLEQGYNGIYFTGVFDGWMRNLSFEDSDSAILTDNDASLTIANITTSSPGLRHRAHYAVHLGAVHNVLVKDLLVENEVIHPLTVNTRSTRSVYLRARVLQNGRIDQHSGSNHQNLFDAAVLDIKPDNVSGRWRYRLWEGGGAPYWKPGHGLYNTVWNARLAMPADVPKDATVAIESGLEGPGARIIGLSANRQITIHYDPEAYIEATNMPVTAVPSLYEYQLARRSR